MFHRIIFLLLIVSTVSCNFNRCADCFQSFIEQRFPEYSKCRALNRFNIKNKNRRKAIFNWAAKGLFFLKGGGGYTHSGYHKTLSATIACDRTSCETET